MRVYRTGFNMLPVPIGSRAGTFDVMPSTRCLLTRESGLLRNTVVGGTSRCSMSLADGDRPKPSVGEESHAEDAPPCVSLCWPPRDTVEKRNGHGEMGISVRLSLVEWR